MHEIRSFQSLNWQKLTVTDQCLRGFRCFTCQLAVLRDRTGYSYPVSCCSIIKDMSIFNAVAPSLLKNSQPCCYSRLMVLL